jgi:hypothetical protein
MLLLLLLLLLLCMREDSLDCAAGFPWPLPASAAGPIAAD